MTIFKEITGQGEDVVVIHGGGVSHKDMRPVAAELAKHYRVTNIDLPGTGSSTWDDAIHTIHDMADYVVKELPSKAIYVGWSFGGLVCQSIAARYPRRVKRFVGIGASPKFIATEGWIGVPQPGFTPIFFSILQAGKGAKDLLKIVYEYEFENIHPKPSIYREGEKLWNGPSSISNELLFKRIEICDATDLRQEFKYIHCPIDLIMGDQDENVPKIAWKNINALNPHVKIHEISGARHAPFWTHPQEFNEILKRIL